MLYDLDTFRRLNDAWADRPIVPQPPRQTPEAMAERAAARVNRIVRQVGLEAGHRVLEIGCGRGHLSRQLATEVGAEAIGVDIHEYPEWADVDTPGVTFVAGDISSSLGLEGTIDRIFSFSVWEHLEHPAAAMEQAYALLRPGGVMFLQAQLLYGPKASHRYREVYFPWPHLLFAPEVFEQFYESIDRAPMRPAFVNAWTALHYRFHVERTGFETLWFSCPAPWFDQEFYDDHREALCIYPTWDLSHDAVMIRVRKPLAPET